VHHVGFIILVNVAPNHTHTHTLGMTPLDNEPTRRRDLHLTTHNIHKRQSSRAPAGFETAIPASERSQTCCRPRGNRDRTLRILNCNLQACNKFQTQVVSSRPLKAETRVQSQAIPRGISGGQRGTGTGFSPSNSGFPCQHHSTGAPCSFIYIRPTLHAQIRQPRTSLNNTLEKERKKETP
jgi:hypothetical protein